MSTKLSVILLKDFALLGKKGELIEIEKEYAQSYLLPKGIVKQITDRQTVNSLKNKQKERHRQAQKKLSESAKALLYQYNDPTARSDTRSVSGKMPPMSLRINLGYKR